MTSDWQYSEELTPELIKDYEGFVYMITNLLTNKKYVGKKTFWSKRKNKITGRRKTTDSDWRRYWSSSEELKADVKEHGEHNFSRAILQLGRSKSELNYLEAKYQFAWDVLVRDDFYNDWIMVKVTKKHLQKYKLALDNDGDVGYN